MHHRLKSAPFSALGAPYDVMYCRWGSSFFCAKFVGMTFSYGLLVNPEIDKFIFRSHVQGKYVSDLRQLSFRREVVSTFPFLKF